MFSLSANRVSMRTGMQVTMLRAHLDASYLFLVSAKGGEHLYHVMEGPAFAAVFYFHMARYVSSAVMLVVLLLTLLTVSPALIAIAAIVALVRDGAPRSRLVRDGWIARIATVQGSLTDDGLVRRTLAEYGIDTVFHLGAQTLVGVAKVDPYKAIELSKSRRYPEGRLECSRAITGGAISLLRVSNLTST